MPTPTGLPKVGEVWEYQPTVFGKPSAPAQRVVVLERGRGDYWSLRVGRPGEKPKLWVDASYFLKTGHLKYIGPAGKETKKKLGLG